MKFRRCVRARDGKRHTDDRSQLPQITQIIYWILLFYFFALALFSTRLVCYALFHLFFRHCSLFLSSLLLFLLLLFFAHFFLLYFSSFSRARVVFRLILFFFLLLLLRPFSHAPPRLLIARNRCDFAHLYVFFFVLSSAHVFTCSVSARTTRLLRLVIAIHEQTHTHSRTHAHTRARQRTHRDTRRSWTANRH